jgi:thymidylate synthase
MSIIVSDSIGDCWINCIKKVIHEGTTNYDEDVKIKEYLGISLKILDPKPDDELINKYADKKILSHTLEKFEKGVVMKDRPFTYGELIYCKNGVDQYEWLIQRLKNKRETKSATICLMETGSTCPNLPCLTTIDAKIREEKLILQFFYRGQNVVGRQYANLIALSKFQRKLAKDLSVKVGFLGGYIASAHIYEYDLKNAEAIIKNEELTLKDNFYELGPKSIRNGYICNKTKSR